MADGRLEATIWRSVDLIVDRHHNELTPRASQCGKLPLRTDNMKNKGGTSKGPNGAESGKRKLRSSLWFDNPDNPGMTALYIERYLNFGLTPAELRSGKPIIGIAQTGSDLSPCNRHHIELAKRVRDGILTAGGVPFEFPVHPIQETGKRPTAALDRNLAYLGLVEILYGYFIDGVVLTTGCDKTTPACIMAAATVNLPAIVLSGGPMNNGWHHGERTGSGTIVWKARAELAEGKIDYEQFMEIVTSSAPSVGHCNTMGTASTMNALAEALGMSLPGCAAIPAPHRERGQIAYETGKRIVEHGLGGFEALRHSDARGAGELDRRQQRDRRLDQRADPHQRDRPPHRRQARHRGLGEGRPSRAAARQHAACGQISGRGVPSRGRRAGRGQRTDEAQARSRERADRERQDDRRELPKCESRRLRRDLSHRQADEGGRGLHRAARQSVRRRRDEDERDRRRVPRALSSRTRKTPRHSRAARSCSKGRRIITTASTIPN